VQLTILWLLEMDAQAEDHMLYYIVLLILLAQLWAFQLRSSVKQLGVSKFVCFHSTNRQNFWHAMKGSISLNFLCTTESAL
jgi:hypothetical protein